MGTEQVWTVLHVEDHPVNARLVRRLLERRGTIRLVVARTGREALLLATDEHPDLVLLDLHLPDVPGEVLLEQLWALPGRSGTPVVVLSADALPATAARLRAQGVVDYMTKPLDVARFSESVDLALHGVTAPRRS